MLTLNYSEKKSENSERQINDKHGYVVIWLPFADGGYWNVFES